MNLVRQIGRSNDIAYTARDDETGQTGWESDQLALLFHHEHARSRVMLQKNVMNICRTFNSL